MIESPAKNAMSKRQQRSLSAGNQSPSASSSNNVVNVAFKLTLDICICANCKVIACLQKTRLLLGHMHVVN